MYVTNWSVKMLVSRELLIFLCLAQSSILKNNVHQRLLGSAGLVSLDHYLSLTTTTLQRGGLGHRRWNRRETERIPLANLSCSCPVLCAQSAVARRGFLQMERAASPPAALHCRHLAIGLSARCRGGLGGESCREGCSTVRGGGCNSGPCAGTLFWLLSGLDQMNPR